MDLVYSIFLLIALVADGLGILAAVGEMWARSGRSQFATRRRRLVPVCIVIACLSGLISALAHLVFGHGPEAAEPMLPGQFFASHPAYWLVGVLSVVLLAIWLTFHGRAGNGG